MNKIVTEGFQFYCESQQEQWRAETMFTKEPGTIAWLKANVRPNDVFWDVGANIGVYSIYAASLGATVFAFEPHVGSAYALLQNAAINGLREKITLVSTPLDNDQKVVPFYYTAKAAGASGNQLHQPIDEQGNVFKPAATELKLTARGDDLLSQVPAPQLVKIDTDGNEFAVLGGMPDLLKRTVRSIQVEIHPQHMRIIDDLLSPVFKLDHRHYTSNGQKQLDAGADPLTVVHNAVYCPIN